MNRPGSPAHPNASAGAGTVRKAMRLLECLAEAPEALGLTEIAQATALNKATAYRLLRVLKDTGLVAQDERDRRYRLGLRLVQFGTQALERLEIRRLARPHMVSLMQATGQTVHLAILEGSEVVYVEKVEGLEAVTLRSRVGGTPPAHATSVGKCLLAFLPLEERELLVSKLPLPRFTRHTITNRAAFLRHLEEVRRRGYAVDNEDHREGLRCVGAPVFDASGRAVAAVSIAGPTFRILPATIPRLARQVMHCAQAISAALGYRRGKSAPAPGPGPPRRQEPAGTWIAGDPSDNGARGKVFARGGMEMLKRHCAWMHLALALVLGLAGRAWAAEEITINVHVKARANTEEMLKKVGEAFTAKYPNGKVKILPLGRAGYEARVVTQLMARSPELDIVNLTNIELGQVAEAKAVDSLDRFLADPGLNPTGLTTADFTPAALKSVSYKGEVYAVPYKFDAIFFFYRTDLIKAPPRTLEEYLELAKKFSRSQSPSSPTEFGTTLQAKRGSVPPKLWAQDLWAYGGALVDDKGKAAVNSQAGVKALTLWVDMLHRWKVVPPDSFSYEFPEVNTAFQQGKVAMSVQWSPADAIFRNKAKSPLVADKVGVAMVPGLELSDGSIRSVPYLQTWNFTISRFSRHREEAYRFLSFMMGHPAYLEYAAKEEIPATRAGLAMPAFKQNPIYAVTMESLEKGRSFPTHAKMVAIRNAADLAIGKALARELAPKAALDEAAREIDREMQ